MLIKGLIVFFVVLLLIAICVLIYILLRNRDYSIETKELALEKEEITIEKLEKLAGDNSLSKNALFELIQLFVGNFSIPAKNNQVMPKEANNYINFIILICSHKNSDAKLISFLDKEAKKKNPSYIVEIEESEKIGIENRKNRR